jgi:hypothetical protein
MTERAPVFRAPIGFRSGVCNISRAANVLLPTP